MTELTVDTAMLLTAANVVADASASFAAAGATATECRLTDDSLGHSPVAREVVTAAAHRVQQAQEATRMAADAADGISARIRAAAATFERIEAAMPVMPR